MNILYACENEKKNMADLSVLDLWISSNQIQFFTLDGKCVRGLEFYYYNITFRF